MKTDRTKNLTAKIVAIGLISILANAGLAAGCRAMDNVKREDTSEIKIVDVSNDEIGTAVIAGGWKIAEDQTVTEDRKEIFEKATEKLVGAKHEPVAYLASQIVSGTNHCYLTKTTTVRPGAEPHYTLVYVYADLDKNATVINIEDIIISADK